MKRFYREVAIAPETGGWTIRLDGKPVRTPARAALLLPTVKLADAVAAEWRAQGETIVPRDMRLTGLANAAIDRIAPDPAAFAAQLAPYAETDVLLYRADAPDALVAAQVAAWDPILDWARTRYDVAFTLVTGIIHRPQPPATVARLNGAILARDPFALAAMHPLVTIGGSLIAALAVAEQVLAPEAAFDATHRDELWQAEQWGEDALATEHRAARRTDYLAAARFLTLLDPGAPSS